MHPSKAPSERGLPAKPGGGEYKFRLRPVLRNTVGEGLAPPARAGHRPWLQSPGPSGHPLSKRGLLGGTPLQAFPLRGGRLLRRRAGLGPAPTAERGTRRGVDLSPPAQRACPRACPFFIFHPPAAFGGPGRRPGRWPPCRTCPEWRPRCGPASPAAPAAAGPDRRTGSAARRPPPGGSDRWR